MPHPSAARNRRTRPFFAGRISQLVLEGFLKAADTAGAPPPSEQLTSREREILQLLVESHSNKATAKRLALSVKTVETRRASVMRKLQLNSLPDLVRFAIRNQIIEP